MTMPGMFFNIYGCLVVTFFFFFCMVFSGDSFFPKHTPNNDQTCIDIKKHSRHGHYSLLGKKIFSLRITPYLLCDFLDPA